MLLSVADLQRLYGVRRRLVMELVRSGIVVPMRGDRREYRFGFQDVLVVRMAVDLKNEGVPIGRALSFLRKLHREEGKRLSALKVTTCGGDVVVRENGILRNFGGQYLLDLGEVTSASAAMVSQLSQPATPTTARPAEYAAVALELEATDPARAAELYREAISLDETYSCAYVNLSCLLIEQGKLDEAIAVCRNGLQQCPEAALLHFNLGVIHDETAEKADAMECYRTAIALEPGLADAHYNLHLLYEEIGETRAALRHLAAYARLNGNLSR